MGQYFCVNAPSKAPLRPEGGVVGEYIDRCIMALNCTDGAVRYISLVKILIYWAGSIVPTIKQNVFIAQVLYVLTKQF